MKIVMIVTIFLGLLGCSSQPKENTLPQEVKTEMATPAEDFWAPGHDFKDTEKWAKVFEDPTREKWQKPDEVIHALKLQDKDVVADVGAGTGYFAFRIAQIHPQVKVYASDIEKTMVDYMRKRSADEKTTNVHIVKATEKSPKIPKKVDVILIVDTYHHLANRQTYFKNLKKNLSKKGVVAIIDFHEKSPIGPMADKRVTKEQLVAEMGKAGYKVVDDFDFLPYQNFLTFR